MTTTLQPCICGTERAPRIRRRGTASHLIVLECPSCKRRTPMSRPEQVDLAWNVEQARLRAKAGTP